MSHCSTKSALMDILEKLPDRSTASNTKQDDSVLTETADAPMKVSIDESTKRIPKAAAKMNKKGDNSTRKISVPLIGSSTNCHFHFVARDLGSNPILSTKKKLPILRLYWRIRNPENPEQAKQGEELRNKRPLAESLCETFLLGCDIYTGTP
ncbi:hypothetical protein ACROYT_G015502 [Oculina patagonica]